MRLDGMRVVDVPPLETMVRPYDEKEARRKLLLRQMRMTQAQLAERWRRASGEPVSQPFVAQLLAARGEPGETRSIERELDFNAMVAKFLGREVPHSELWPPHRGYKEPDAEPEPSAPPRHRKRSTPARKKRGKGKGRGGHR